MWESSRPASSSREAGGVGSPRLLHPGAWWTWAIGCAIAASRTSNPLLLLLLVLTSTVVVHMRRPDAPWAGSFRLFLRLGLAIVIVRVVLQVVFVAGIGTTVILPLPGFALPEWLAGIRLGGDVTAEALLMGFYDGLHLATIVICLGAANALASPARLLKSVPAALYELGVSIVVAMTFVPQLAADVERLQSARRLRGRSVTGVRAIAGSALPVLEGALERSVMLAAAMDSRGYGRTRHVPLRHRRAMATSLLAGLGAACIGVFGLLTAAAPTAIAIALVFAGCAATVAAAWAAGRRRIRTNYRPDPWRTAEWCVLGSGVVVAGIFVGCATWGIDLSTSTFPPAWPSLPLLAIVGIVMAVTPAWTAPLPPVSRRSTSTSQLVTA